MNTNYLTEASLYKILEDIFQDEQIERQYIFKNVKIDFGIRFKNKNINFENCLGIDSVKNNTILIEFDGYHHFTETSQVVKDLNMGLGLSKWNRINENTFGIRIPYFVQLDHQMSKLIFGVNVQLNSYPHGFIDKKACMPTRFCNYGEKRFIKDLKNLPFSVGREIFDSIINRYEKNKLPIYASMSYNVFESLTKYFYRDKYDIISNKNILEEPKDEFEKVLLYYKKRYEQIERWL